MIAITSGLFDGMQQLYEAIHGPGPRKVDAAATEQPLLAAIT